MIIYDAYIKKYIYPRNTYGRDMYNLTYHNVVPIMNGEVLIWLK